MTDDTAQPPLSPPPSMGDAAMRTFFDQSNAARQHIADSAMAADLDGLGDYLLARAESMQAISTMSEPVRADAVAIARDILRKLKISFGAATILDGLGLRNAEDGVLFGGIREVVQIYEHMVAWACGVDASILGDPSIQAAIAAIGKIGYLAKRESLRLARQANLALLANRVAQQLAVLDAQFAGAAQENMASLLDTIERGMNRVINRVTSVSVSGAAVSHAQDNLGHFMSAAPTAGQARSLSADTHSNRDAVGKRNTEALLAEEAAHQAEAARIQAQNARNKRNEKAASTVPARPAAAAGRQAVQQARTAQRRQQSTAATPQPPATTNAVNNARINSIHHTEEEAHHHHDHELQVQRQVDLIQRQNAQRAAQRVNAQRMAKQTGVAPQKPLAHADLSHAMESAHHIDAHHADAAHHPVEPAVHHPVETTHATTVPAIDPHLLKGIDLKGFDMSGVTGAPIATSRVELNKQLAAAAHDPDKLLPPLPPTQNKGLVR